MALGLRSMTADLGEDVELVLRSDSSAALGTTGRPGLGKLRNLETCYLWLQDAVSKKRIRIRKVRGTDNPADLGTKHLKIEDITEHFELLGFHFHQGRTLAVPSVCGDDTRNLLLLVHNYYRGCRHDGLYKIYLRFAGGGVGFSAQGIADAKAYRCRC